MRPSFASWNHLVWMMAIIFFVMEFVAGGTLERLVAEKKLEIDSAISLIIYIAEAVAQAHEEGYVHRDIKPSNVLVAANGKAKLTDFDLVTAVDSTGGTRSSALGTIVYAPPEMMRRPQEADATADVFGLAMTLVFALHGETPDISIYGNIPGVIDALVCPPKVKDVLKRALEVDPKKRYLNAGEFRQALQDAKTQDNLDAPPTGATLGISADIALADRAPMRFVRLSGGEFTMGSPDTEKDRYDDEGPRHRVRVSAFEIAENEVTQLQWRIVMGRDPSECDYGCGDDLPVHNVSWLTRSSS